MSTRWLTLIATAAALLPAGSLAANASDSAAPTTLVLPDGPAKLTFDDEFNATELDRDKWATNLPNAFRALQGEQEIYLPDDLLEQNGLLQIRTDDRHIDGANYTSGAITTFGTFAQAYGYFEVRAKLPAGDGLWPAFWLAPASLAWPPEIDGMEFLGRDSTTVYDTYHWVDGSHQHQMDGSPIKAANWTEDFHTFAVNWRPGLVSWIVDGKEVKRVSGPQVTATPMYLLLNMAVGGGWARPANATTPLPSYFDIDYVRAYQYDDLPATPAPDWQILATTASTHLAAPGDSVAFNIGVKATQPLPPFNLQAVLQDSTGQKKIANTSLNIAASPAGAVVRNWTVKLSSSLTPGLYVLSVGAFAPNHRQLWLTNATTVLVQ